jgi:alanine racemase
VLKERFPEVEVLSLLGPLDGPDYDIACEKDLLVQISHTEQLLRLEEAAKQTRTPARIALKFETGMGRLGFTLEEVRELAETLRGLQYTRVELICSHLATSEQPEQAEYTREQGRRFSRILDALSASGITAPGCLANSGAIFSKPDLHYDRQRPGLSLYGGNPFYGTAWAEKAPRLQQVMTVSTRLIQVRTLRAGQSLSYGATYTAPKDMRVGIAAVGYADSYSRRLSGTGWMIVHGRRVPVLGRVCMQMTAVDLDQVPEASPGDQVFIMGGNGPEYISADEIADWGGSISYEIFCLFGKNPREYIR